MAMDAVQHELNVVDGFFRTRLEDTAQRALSMADEMALNTAVQDAFAARNRDALSKMLVPHFADLKQRHDVVQLQFHTAPATSFLRVHSAAKFGDDLSSFRFTVVDVNNTKKPVHGLEYGVEGLGVRGVVPVFHHGAHVGSVEVGLSFGKPFLDDFKNASHAEAAFFLKTPQGFRAFASTFATLPQIGMADMNAAMTKRSQALPIRIGDVDHAFVLAPVNNYRGDAIGVVMLAVDRSSATAALNDTWKVSLGVGVLLLAVTLLLLFFLNRGIVLPLKSLTNGLQDLASGNFSIILSGVARNDEIGDMARAVRSVMQQIGRAHV